MTVAIRQLRVPREQRFIHQGSAVTIIVDVADVALVSMLLDPSFVPTISLYDSLGVNVVSNDDMTRLQLGIYSYVYQTLQSSPLGLYRVNVHVRHNTKVAHLEGVVVFKIVKASVLPLLDIFSYFAIKDQLNNIWYWHIAEDNTPSFSTTIPVIVGKTATLSVITPTPYWLAVNNPTPALRYIYPLVTGELTVTAIQPVVGTGVASPILISGAGDSFTYDVNTAEEVILVSV